VKNFSKHTPIILAAIAAALFITGMLIPPVSLAFALVSLGLSMFTYFVSKKQNKKDSHIFGIGIIASCIMWIISIVYVVALILINTAATAYLSTLL